MRISFSLTVMTPHQGIVDNFPKKYMSLGNSMFVGVW